MGERERADRAKLVRADDPADAGGLSAERVLRSPAAIAIFTLGLLAAAPYFVSGFERFRLFTPLPPGESFFDSKAPAPSANQVVGEAEIKLETRDDENAQQPEIVELPAAAREIVPPPTAEEKPRRSIEDPSGKALDPFFRKLMAVERKDVGQIARAMYYGDSIVATDFITGTLRRRLQKRFGDAGHGFVLMANAWPGYSHNDIKRYASPGWQVSRVVGPWTKDGLYGIGGVSFRSQGPGLFTRVGTTDKGTFGRSVSKFVVAYLEQPEGAQMEVKIDGEVREVIETSGPQVKSAWKTFTVPDGAHEMEVRPLAANARAFGIWMEREGPGVVLDAIGIQGGHLRQLDHADDAHFAEQLKARDPSLVMFQYSINEVEDGEAYPLSEYEVSATSVLQQTRAALPNAACLVVGPLDRADKQGDVYTGRPFVPKLAAMQRKVALACGCAYWDTFAAMGGSGSMGIWIQRGLGSTDLAHPSSAGAEVLGNWVYLALMEAYEAYKTRQSGASSPGSAAAPTGTEAPTAAPR